MPDPERPARLRILITNTTLATRTGTELYVRDLARALAARGHLPIVYSTDLGAIAEELRAATIPVVDDLHAVGEPPDVIHGHHHPETMTALLHFPGVPGVFFCHDWVAWHDEAPLFPRLVRYAAVSWALRDRLVLQHGVPPERVRLMLNSVDLTVFTPRPPLPPRPARALFFCHNAEGEVVTIVEAACARAGMTLDVVGAGVGNVVADPARMLGRYDLVFASGRSALEALAVGTAVVVCDRRGIGPLVTAAELARLRELNFGLRLFTGPVTEDAVRRAIAAYDSADATIVHARIRAEAGLDAAADAHVALYREVIAAHAAGPPSDPPDEARAVAEYLRRVAPWKLIRWIDGDNRALRSEIAHWRAQVETLQALQARQARFDASWVGRLLSSYGVFKHRVLMPGLRRLGARGVPDRSS
jgi:hypothetical protein